MNRYIDAHELLNRLPDELPYKSSVLRDWKAIYQSTMICALLHMVVLRLSDTQTRKAVVNNGRKQKTCCDLPT